MDDEDLLSDQILFGKHTPFVTSRLYSGKPDWDYLFEYWTSLYKK